MGFEAAIRSGPKPEAKLISVGENPIIALYKLSKVCTCRCTEVYAASRNM